MVQVGSTMRASLFIHFSNFVYKIKRYLFWEINPSILWKKEVGAKNVGRDAIGAKSVEVRTIKVDTLLRNLSDYQSQPQISVVHFFYYVVPTTPEPSSSRCIGAFCADDVNRRATLSLYCNRNYYSTS